jgi:hypothetical protein
MATKKYDSEDTQYQNPQDEATQYQNPDDEATQCQSSDDEATQLNTPDPEPKAQAKQDTNSQSKPNPTTTDKSGTSWKHTAVSATAGVLIGAAVPVFMSMDTKGDAEAQDAETPEEKPNHSEVLSNPEVVDDEVMVATTVSDDMSFGQAFAAARAEVGPGGVFEWHGNLYGTYTAEEWNSMSAEERAEYGEHFAWNKMDHQHSDVAPQHHETAEAGAAEAQDDDIPVTHVDHPTDEASQSAAGDDVPVTQVDEPATTSDSDVVVLGVEHDDESGANYGGLLVDGHNVLLVDVDGDMKFDYSVTDVNDNGEVDAQDLVQDISGAGITVDMLQSPTDTQVTDSGADYSGDGGYEA